jgi:hypothetical protein
MVFIDFKYGFTHRIGQFIEITLISSLEFALKLILQLQLVLFWHFLVLIHILSVVKGTYLTYELDNVLQLEIIHLNTNELELSTEAVKWLIRS